MAINKNFVIKNGLEVNTNLVFADADNDRVGIGTTLPQYKLEVTEDIGSRTLYVGNNRNTLSVVAAAAGLGNSVGIGTSLPSFLLDVRSPVSTGQTAVYVKGDVRVTGISTIETSLFVGSGPLVVGSATSTGIANQRLQISGGAYIADNVGIGTTIPGAELHVIPASDGIAGLFSGSSSTDLVRITQTGTGNALVVEDAANPDSTPFVVNTNGNTGVGTTNPTSKLHAVGDVLLSGITTVSGDTLFSNQLSVAGFSTFNGITTNTSTLFANQLSVSGFSTFNGITTNTSTLFSNQLSVSGVSTFNGITTNTSTLFANQLSVSGISTFNGITTVTGPTLFSRQISVAGVITANNGIQGIGIQSGGLNIAVGVITALNFIGVGNTFNYNSATGKVDISISGGQWTYSDLSDTLGDVYRLTGDVGIGTTNPTSKLHVLGDVLLSGISTLAGITTITGDTLFTKQLSVAGLSTFNNSILPSEDAIYDIGSPSKRWGDLYVSSIVGNLVGGASTIVVQSDVENATRYLTFFEASSGIGTLRANTNLTYNPGSVILSLQNGLLLVGSATSTGTASQRLQVTGGAYVSGNAGIGTTNPTSNLHVVGNSLLSNLLITSVGTGATVGSAGIVTYFGDGSQLSGTGILISANTTDQNQFLTYAVSTGSTSGLGITASNLVFNPSTTRLGIGTTNPTQTVQINSGTSIVSIDNLGDVGIGTTIPTSKLHVIGDALIIGISTFSGITTNTSTLFANQLSVSGFSTFNGITTVTGTTLFSRQISNSGFSTLGTGATVTGTLFTNQLSATGFSTFSGITTNTSTLFANQLSVSGVSTFNGITTNTSTLFANQLSVSGFSTFNGITTNTSTLFANQLSVSGVSTFNGITTVTGTTLFSKQFNVSGVSTFNGITTNTSTLFANQLGVVGFSTFNGITTNTSTLFANQLGVVGFSTFNGITTNTSTLFANQLGVVGFSTFNGITTNTSTLFSNQLSVAGFSTFNGITTNTSTLFANQISIAGFSTFNGITTNTSTLFANQLSVAGVSTFAGITTVTGTTLFAKQLNVVGIVTASELSNATLTNYAEKVNTLGNTGATPNINVANGTYVTATLDQSATFTFTSPPSGAAYGFSLQLTNGVGGPFSITWPGSVKWPGNTIPVRTTANSKTDIWSFTTTDGGVNWYGAISLYNFS